MKPESKNGASLWRVALHDIRLVLIAAGGGALCFLMGIPAPWLTGAMLISALAICGFGWRIPSRPVVDTAMLLCGLLLGSTATPEALAAAAHYPASLGLMVAAVMCIIMAAGAYLVVFAKWPAQDAVLASVPGALSAVMAIALERGIGVHRIAIIQLFRLFALIAALPGLVVFSGISPSDLRPVAAVTASPQGLLALGVAGVAASMLFERLGITAPIILGATFVSAVLHGTGWVHGTLPADVAILGFVLLGTAIGGRFAGVTPRAVLEAMPVALIAFMISITVAMIFAWPAAHLAGVSYATALIAFAPGGLEAMSVLAFSMGLDPLYVGAHHLLRFLLVGFGLPVMLALMARRGGKE